jgi:hypothetical protein
MLLILILGSGLGKQPATCDLIELNHFYSEDNGKLAYSQYIAYAWCPTYRRYNVVAWCLDSKNTPVKRGDWWWLKWDSFEAKGMVRAKLFRETHTTTDPERENKKLHAEKFRERFLAK